MVSKICPLLAITSKEEKCREDCAWYIIPENPGIKRKNGKSQGFCAINILATKLKTLTIHHLK